MRICDELNKRGLEGSDLETMIDTFLQVSAGQFATIAGNRSTEAMNNWARTLYGNDAVRLVAALAAIGGRKEEAGL